MSSADAAFLGSLRARFMAGLLGVSAGFLANPARAHFSLQAPPSWAMQDASGNPQKSAPCGQAACA